MRSTVSRMCRRTSVLRVRTPRCCFLSGCLAWRPCRGRVTPGIRSSSPSPRVAADAAEGVEAGAGGGRMRRLRRVRLIQRDIAMLVTPSGPCAEVPYRPHRLVLQWHVTERCNLRCTHCYQESYSGDELPFDDLLRLLQQYKDLLDAWGRPPWSSPVRGHVTVTGGEPFVRTDFLDLLEVFAANRRRFSFAVLTNGSFINAALAYRLRQLRPAYVQVSIEGTRATHDNIRGAGNYDRTLAAVRHLVRSGIRTMISFSAHRANFREFPEVCRLGHKLRVSRVWADRVIPWGSGKGTPRATADTW